MKGDNHNNGKTRFKAGQSGNPGGRPKQVAALLKYCRRRTKKALALCAKLIEDETTTFDEPKDRIAWMKLRLEAGRFLSAYGMGAPPKAETLLASESPSDTPKTPLTVEELRNLARQSLADEQDDEADDDDEAGPPPH